MSPLLLALVLYVVVLAGTVAYALFKGGNDERSGAIVLLILALLTQVLSVIGSNGRMVQGWEGPELDVMVLDGLGFVAFVVIAYRSKKFWPIWAAASQLVATLTHWVVILNPSILRTLYMMAQPFWVFPVIIAIAVGTRSHQRSLR